MPDHTPGPIHVEHEFNLIANDGHSLTGLSLSPDSARAHARNVANALHAVKCWNSHDALVAACKEAELDLSLLYQNVEDRGDSLQAVRAALKLAGAK